MKMIETFRERWDTLPGSSWWKEGRLKCTQEEYDIYRNELTPMVKEFYDKNPDEPLYFRGVPLTIVDDLPKL